MKILFVHQNYHAQYKHLLAHLTQSGEHQIAFLTQRRGLERSSTHYIITYQPDRRPDASADPYASHYRSCCANGAGVAQLCSDLERQGFRPDIVIGHSGWGETLFIKDVWPDVPVLAYFEYFYRNEDGAVGFDPEHPISEKAPFAMSARNAVNYLSLAACDRGQTATRWQRDGYPDAFHQKLVALHEGVRTDICRPNPNAQVRLGRVTRAVRRNDEIFTFIARNMEPVRGFHIFMRALPAILESRPQARAVIIGGNGVSYGEHASTGETFRAVMEKEVGAAIDWSRVHFVGQVPYKVFVAVLQLSRCHIYLTTPFVPSWSLLEAMSVGATVVSSDVAPVREIIETEKTGFLVDFLDPTQLADNVIEVLSHRNNYRCVGRAARAHIVGRYDFNDVLLKKHLALINSMTPRRAHIVS